MHLARYDDLAVETAKLTNAIHKAELLLGTLKSVEAGSVPARRTLIDLSRDVPYDGPTVMFRLDDLFYEPYSPTTG